jgi:hypothetical protein
MSTSVAIEQIYSFYGPGTILCWVFVFLSVLISWTLNVASRAEDSVDNDFIALLTIPAVAAGHLIYQIIHFPGGYSNIFTGQSFLGSLEASLTVCETFVNFMAPGLFAIAFYRVHLKRAGMIGVVILANLAPQLMLHFQPGALHLIIPPSVHDSSKTAHSMRDYVSALAQRNSKVLWVDAVCDFRYPHFIDIEALTMFIIVVRCIEVILAIYAMYVLVRHPNQNAFWMRLVASWTGIMLPAVAFSTFATHIGAFGYTIHTESTSFLERLAFFMPNSNGSVMELDQAVAVGAGIVTLLLSAYHAWASRPPENTSS